jgi:hypothetical protein
MAETPTRTRTDRRARWLTKLALAAAIGPPIGNRRGIDPRLVLVLEAHDLDRAVGTRGYRRRRRCVTFAARSSQPCLGCGPSLS